MSKYKRMTERDEWGNADIIGVDSGNLQGNLMGDEFNRVTLALNRLAELEDKIESGKMVELPCINTVNKHLIQVVYRDKIFGIVTELFKISETDQAEARLKELRGESV